MQVLKCLFLSTLILFFFSCGKDSETNSSELKSYAQVDQRLWQYFQLFEEEAAKRGIDINLNEEEISGEIRDIDPDNVAGTCHFQSHSPNHVTVDIDYWNRTNSLGREFVVFHELGHCSLLRGHSEATDANGQCKSIMASGTGSCMLRYNGATRETMINELFKNF